MGLQLPKRAAGNLRRVAAAGRAGHQPAAARRLLVRDRGASGSASPCRTPRPRRASTSCSLWQGAWIAALVTGVMVWGLIFYACVALPPPQRRRDPGADPLQPADRDLLHDRADHHGDRVLLPHRRRSRTTCSTTPTTGRPHHHGRRPAVVVDVQLRHRQTTLATTTADRRPYSTYVYEAGTAAYIPTLVLPVDKTVAVQPALARRDPLFWVPAFLIKMDVIPGRDNHFSDHPDPRGHVRGQVRRALRRLPLADALQRQGRQPEPTTTRTSRSSQAAGQHPAAAARRLRGLHPGRARVRQRADGGAE